MQIFYTQDISDAQLTLHDQEAQHCFKVLRHNIGDEINVMDGKGHLLQAKIISANKKSVVGEIVEKKYFDVIQGRPHIAFGLIKNNTRLEWMIEKLTEIGVASIQPLICQRSEKRTLKEDRLQKIILSASKQSKQYHFPVLAPLKKFKDYIASPIEGDKYIAHYVPGQQNIWEVNRGDMSTFLIGPEGDFTTQEYDLSVQGGFQSVNLGQSRLRAETAAIVACTHLNS